MVVIDALPWATIAAMQNESGIRETLPESASTPLALRLAPGSYRVTLQGPPPQSELRSVALRVEPGKPAIFPPQRFSTITADEYFNSYLLPAGPVAIPETPASEGAP